MRIKKALGVVSLMTLISRLLGFVRDLIFALVFGAGPTADAFILAFKLPNFMRRLFAEGAFSQAFVPVLSEYRFTYTQSVVSVFIQRVSGALCLALIVCVCLIEFFAPEVVMVFAPGFDGDASRFDLTVSLAHIVFPYLILISMAALGAAVLNTYERFTVPAWSPIVFNVVLIGVMWFWVPHAHTPIFALAWGVLIGGWMQVLVQYPALLRLNMWHRPKWSWGDPGVMRVLRLMCPAVLGVSVAQIGLLIDNGFASFLKTGSISWLYYSDRLIYLPQGIVGVALATVILPRLSRQCTEKDQAAYSKTLDWAVRIVLLIGLPAATGLMVLGGPIVTTLMYRGAFGAWDVCMTQKSLCTLALGLPAFMMIKILVSGFYAHQDLRTPVTIACWSLGVNVMCDFLFMAPFAHAGLALATSLSALLNMGLLMYQLHRRRIYQIQAGWVIFLMRTVCANGIMGLVLYGCSGSVTEWINQNAWMRTVHLMGLMTLGVVVYGLSLWYLGIRKQDVFIE